MSDNYLVTVHVTDPEIYTSDNYLVTVHATDQTVKKIMLIIKAFHAAKQLDIAR